MEVFLKEISFHGVMLDTLFDSPDEWKQTFQRQVQESIDSGAIKPLVRTVFESDQIEQAFRYMAAGKHIGKVLIRIRSEEEESFITPIHIPIMAYPKVMFDKNSSCIICGNYNEKYLHASLIILFIKLKNYNLIKVVLVVLVLNWLTGWLCVTRGILFLLQGQVSVMDIKH